MNEVLVSLYRVVNDEELEILDALCHRAGYVWTCDGPHEAGKPARWTNDADELCEVCGRAKKQ